MMTPTERYQHDPVFRQLVDYIEIMIEQAKYTPTELREAVILAATNYEMRRPPRPMYVDPHSNLMHHIIAEKEDAMRARLAEWLPAIPGHQHTFDAYGHITCGCTVREEKG